VYRSYSCRVSQPRYLNILFLAQNHILRPPDRCQMTLSFTDELSFFLHFSSIHRAQKTRSGNQMYSGSSVKVQQLIQRSHPLLAGGQKCTIWRIFNLTQLWAARVWKSSKISELRNKSECCDDRLCPHRVWWSWVHAPLRSSATRSPPLKLHGENVLNSIVNNSAVDYSISLIISYIV